MPTREHLVLCGGVRRSGQSDATALRLDLHGPSRNVMLRIQDLSARLVSNIPDTLVDLLEVAAYVYAADSAIGRGSKTDAQLGARWRRRLSFVVPLRRPNLWISAAVSSALRDLLGFMSDDTYTFEFRPLDVRPKVQSYLELSGEDIGSFSPDEVVLFSGGIDSFAGAVERLAADGKSVALVSHRSATKIASTQTELVASLRARFGRSRILHIPVLVNLDERLGRESTHRTRSFLFGSLGAATARLFSLDRISFFENGVVSMNLPLLAQVVGARATRTTHPQVLAGFRDLLSGLFECPFSVTNPFVWRTKAEIVEGISAHGFGDLIRDTRSCTRVRDMTRQHPHCGLCSQCIDRRFAVLAAGVADQDPAEAYRVDLLTGERDAGPDRELALAYERAATEINRMAGDTFFAHYGEVSRIVAYFAEPAGEVAERILGLLRRHSAGVCDVIDRAIAEHASALREGSLPPTALLTLVTSRAAVHPVSSRAIQRGRTVDPEQVSGKSPEGAARLPTQEIRIAIHPNGREIIIEGWGRLRNASAELLISLARPHEKAISERRAPENHPFTATRKLAGMLGKVREETLRRRVLRCRTMIAQLAQNAGAIAPALDAVIENNQPHGYRLNPDTVRIVAITELTASK
jgi:7-cyano-7-deazaguanine synthase in queuosine biosynthesis